ncbi:MAG: hypothetical protein OEW08_03715, partial [Gammaproteobacteria bacterium]|nr:hypothetical protein [Gammaproteobacteria bacterium]
MHCTPIFHIQGATERSAYAGKEVTTRGIVTFWAADHKLYWVQDPLGDGEPSTSDAISVVYRAAQGVRPEIGDWIELTGLVEDYETANGIPVTRLTPMRDVIVHANAQSLPTPIEITQVPTQSIVAARSFWLALEGMRVVLHNAAVVGPTDAAGEFVVLNTDKSSPHAPPGHALVNPLGPNEVDYHAERVVIAAKPLQLTPFKTGDTLAQVVGIVDYRRSQYKILAQDVTVGVLAPAPQPAIRNLAGNFAVVTMNVENLFDLEDDPNKTDEGDTPTPRQLEIKLRKLSSMIVETLNVPALLILQEVENQTILQVLGDRVNAMAGTRYVATSFDSSDARGIETGLLWDANQIQGMRAQSVTQSLYMELTGDASNVLGREPILAWLKFGDRDIAVLGVHLKSKRGDDPLFGARQPPLRNSEDLRKLQARALRNVIDHVAASIPEALWVVAGDFNDFSFGEPGEGEDHPLAIVRAEHTRFPLLETTDWVR